MSENPEKLRRFCVAKNQFLRKSVVGYHVLDYFGYGKPGNPQFILTLKNTFCEKKMRELNAAKEEVKKILCKYIPRIMEMEGETDCVLVCAPRAKARNTYAGTQMYLQEGVSEAAWEIEGIEDAADAIVRMKDTRTTHLGETVERVKADGSREANTGKRPYPGITKDTCKIDRDLIWGETVILVDDIYTPGVNIDEDCIQALYDKGAERVILFALAYTV